MEAAMRLAGKIALITGSSKGIGRSIAERFAQEGADIVINYNRTPRGAEEALRNVEATGRRGLIVKADLSSITEVRKLVATAIEHFGRLDILVNNAGIETHAPFWEVTEEDYDRVLNVNLKGVFFATQEIVRHLIATKRPGKIINISSVHEELPFPNFAAYCVSKGGLKMLTRNLSVELGQFGITINSIAPGAIETPINTSSSMTQRSSAHCWRRFRSDDWESRTMWLDSLPFWRPLTLTMSQVRRISSTAG